MYEQHFLSEVLHRSQDIMKDSSDSSTLTPKYDAFGPGLHFQAEPLLSTLIPYIQNKEKAFATSGDRSLLVLVAGWPHKPDFIQAQYNEFIQLIKKCFDQEDLETKNDGILPAVYLYPSEALHVTIATLSPHIPSITASDLSHIQHLFQSILTKASQLPIWPNKPLRLQISSSQIGIKAGILQWEETTGGILSMRSSIRQIIQDCQSTHSQRDLDIMSKVFIPNIVHSSILRFSKVPQTSGRVVQERFEKLVKPFLKEYFADEVVLDSVIFVRERTVFMHIPKDHNHILNIYKVDGDDDKDVQSS